MVSGLLRQIIQVRKMKDIFGQALLDYHYKIFEPSLLLHNDYGSPETIPPEQFFGDEDEFSELECVALDQVSGRVLDIGSATGRHALYLQNLGYDITAMDISECCGTIMKETGLNRVVIDDVYTYRDQKFDTIIMLMNGIGIAGNIEGLKKLFLHLKSMLQPGGQLLVDSSDISYLYDDIPKPPDKYFGELTFQYEYKNMKSDPVHWLYIDQKKLITIANSMGWSCHIIFEDETDAYLAILKMQ